MVRQGSCAKTRLCKHGTNRQVIRWGYEPFSKHSLLKITSEQTEVGGGFKQNAKVSRSNSAEA